MRPFWKWRPKRNPKVIPPANKRTPVIVPPPKEEITLTGPKFYIPPERTQPRKQKKPKTHSNVLALPQNKGADIAKKTGKDKPPPIASREVEKEFLRVFNQFTYMYSPWSVWRDFIVLFACTISNAVDKKHYDEREELYMKTIKQYTKEHCEWFSNLLAITVAALESEPEQDFLGKLFMLLELHNNRKPQFFTPYNVCEENIVPEVKQKGYITINDPCCGTGEALIARIHTARKALEKEGLNFQNHVLVTGQDVDSTVALMCYIQLSLLDMAGYIKIGNSLTKQMTDGDSLDGYWFTPLYFTDIWVTRRILQKVDALFNEKEKNDG
jgi:type I restriction-modification system DNA methylase subunit